MFLLYQVVRFLFDFSRFFTLRKARQGAYLTAEIFVKQKYSRLPLTCLSWRDMLFHEGSLSAALCLTASDYYNKKSPLRGLFLFSSIEGASGTPPPS